MQNIITVIKLYYKIHSKKILRNIKNCWFRTRNVKISSRGFILLRYAVTDCEEIWSILFSFSLISILYVIPYLCIYTCKCTVFAIYKMEFYKFQFWNLREPWKIELTLILRCTTFLFPLYHHKLWAVAFHVINMLIYANTFSDEYESRNSVKIVLYCNFSNLHERAWMNSIQCWVTLRFWLLTARLDVLSAADDVFRGCWQATDCVVCVLRLSRKFTVL